MKILVTWCALLAAFTSVIISPLANASEHDDFMVLCTWDVSHIVKDAKPHKKVFLIQQGEFKVLTKLPDMRASTSVWYPITDNTDYQYSYKGKNHGGWLTYGYFSIYEIRGGYDILHSEMVIMDGFNSPSHKEIKPYENWTCRIEQPVEATINLFLGE